jgi:hypothetical protein
MAFETLKLLYSSLVLSVCNVLAFHKALLFSLCRPFSPSSEKGRVVALHGCCNGYCNLATAAQSISVRTRFFFWLILLPFGGAMCVEHKKNHFCSTTNANIFVLYALCTLVGLLVKVLAKVDIFFWHHTYASPRISYVYDMYGVNACTYMQAYIHAYIHA